MYGAKMLKILLKIVLAAELNFNYSKHQRTE